MLLGTDNRTELQTEERVYTDIAIGPLLSLDSYLQRENLITNYHEIATLAVGQ